VKLGIIRMRAKNQQPQRLVGHENSEQGNRGMGRQGGEPENSPVPT
jgi:hypothetical protein